MPQGIRVLSLDCFDTLLWRQVAQPADVFFNLQSSALYLTHGITADMRVNAEIRARRKRKVLADSFEVTLADIYRELLPQAEDNLVEHAVAAELDAEFAHSFIYEPVAHLISSAHARGLRVIVVSDTYLSNQQLRQLLTLLMGDDSQKIQQVYCSSDLGISKTTGIWPEILRQEKCQPQQLFHLGDNPLADQFWPAKHGVQSAWLQNHTDEVASQLASRINVALQLMPELRYTDC